MDEVAQGPRAGKPKARGTPPGLGLRKAMTHEAIEELVVALVRLPAVRRAAVRLLEPAHFCRTQEDYLEVLWGALRGLAVADPDAAVIPYAVLYDACREVADTR